VDVTGALGAFDAGQHGVGHRTAEGGDAGGELALGEAAFGAEYFDGASGPYSGRSDFQGSCCHGSICSFHSPVWLTGDRRLCCARRTGWAYGSEYPVGGAFASSMTCSDVGCCVVACTLSGSQRVPDMMLLASPDGALFRQPAIR